VKIEGLAKMSKKRERDSEALVEKLTEAIEAMKSGSKEIADSIGYIISGADLDKVERHLETMNRTLSDGMDNLDNRLFRLVSSAETIAEALTGIEETLSKKFKK
jgi:chaperonin cofactor prefoldin